jgi:hypothetical protein
MIASFQHVASMLGLPIVRQDGVIMVTGHWIRIGAAQALSRLGMSKWEIQLFGRWGSDAVLGYLQDAPLTNLSGVVPRLFGRKNLDDILAMGTSSGPGMTPPSNWIETLQKKLNLSAAVVDTLKEAQSTGLAALWAAPFELPYVVNLDSGCFHLITSGDHRASPASWTTTCGWRFGLTIRSARRQVLSDDPRTSVCASCMPEIRASRKKAAKSVF